MCSMCLTAKKQPILDVWVGLFQAKRKMTVPMHDTFDLGSVFWLVMSEVAAVLGGQRDDDFSL